MSNKQNQCISLLNYYCYDMFPVAILLGLLRWHLLVKLCTFQVFISTLHHHNSIFDLMLFFLVAPIPLTYSLVTTKLLSLLSVFMSYFICLSCLFVSLSFTSHIFVKSHSSWFFLSDFFLKILPCCHKWQYFNF